jgi:hypothetical protein
MLLSDRWHNIPSMKEMLRSKVEELVAQAVAGWVDSAQVLAAMNNSAGLRSWLPVGGQSAVPDGAGDEDDEVMMFDDDDSDSDSDDGSDSDGGRGGGSRDGMERGGGGGSGSMDAPIQNIRRVDDREEEEEEGALEGGGSGDEDELNLDEASATAYRLFTLKADNNRALLNGAAESVTLVLEYAALRKKAVANSECWLGQYREKRMALLAAGKRANSQLAESRRHMNTLTALEKSATMEAFDLAAALVGRLSGAVPQPSAQRFVINHNSRPGDLWQAQQRAQLATAVRRTAPLRISQRAMEVATAALKDDRCTVESCNETIARLKQQLSKERKKRTRVMNRIEQNQDLIRAAQQQQPQPQPQ